MKLYFSKGACSLAVRIIINELQLPCEYEAVDLKTKKTAKGEDFLKINPKGSVPVIVTDHQDILSENAVIQQYLADVNAANTLLPLVKDFKRYHVLEWLNFISTELHKNFAPLFNPTIAADIKENIFKPLIKSKMKFVETALTKNKYIAGEYFTLPDSYLFVILRWLIAMEMDIKEWPSTTRYFDTLKNRQSIAKSLQEEGLT